MTTHSFELPLPDESSTESLARSLAQIILDDHATQSTQQAQAAGTLHLSGDLGAGKTTFARAFLRHCGVTGRIKSPTFALLEAYTVSSLNFYHIDFYRFSDSREWADAGFRDLFQPNAIVLIEWPEKASDALPAPDVLLQLFDHDLGRIGLLNARTPRGTRWLNKLQTQQLGT